MLSIQLYDIWFITNGIVQIIIEIGCTKLFFLCNLESKLTATIIIKYCWMRSCCHASRKYPVTISYSNRTVHLRTGRVTIALLRRETPDFISPNQWPPNSPDMNPVNYKIWAVMQERVYEKRVNDVDRRAVSAPVECVAQHWTKRHRRSDRSVACPTHCLCTSKRGSFWAPDVK